jgi:hypothetical protein
MQSTLIPTEILSAIQALGAVAALSFVNTGDRSLNAAIATVLTACIAVLIERIKTFKTLTDVFNIFNVSKQNVSIKKSIEATFNYQKHYFNEDACQAALAWVYTTPAWKQITGYGSKEYLRQVDGDKVLEESANPGRNVLRARAFDTKDNYVPVWYCDKTKKFVYVRGGNDLLGIVGLSIIFGCDRIEPLDAVKAAIDQILKKTHMDMGSMRAIKTIHTSNFSVTTVGKISRTKSFDHIFFEQKSSLLDYLHRFKNGIMYANGDENRGSVLMHGPAGTGKSSCIAAIANFLGFDVLRVTGSQMRNRKLMEIVFNMTDIVIAFDEFDCLLDIIQRQNTSTDEPRAELAASILKLAIAETDPKKHEQIMKRYDDTVNSANEKVDFEFILSKFQGYEYLNKRFIVGCTNNLHLINPTLLRKGRFDIVLELGNATPQMIVDIVADYFKVSDKTALEAEFIEHLPVKTLPPVEILHMAASAASARSVFEQLVASK